jgi:hypothetical protein
MNAFTTGPESTAADRHNRRATGISSEAEERRMETLEIMNTPVENDAEEENDDDDDEEEEALAPVAGWRFWWIFARFPLGLLLVNTILLALITLYNPQYSPSYIVGNSTDVEMNDDFDSDERRDFGLAQFSALELQSWIVKCGMVALLACLDAIVFYWFTVRLKKGMELLAQKAQQEEPQGRPVANENLNRTRTAPLHKLDLNYSELDLVHARVTQKIDSYLFRDPARQPTVPILVSLLYLLTALTVTACLTTLSLLIFLYSSEGSSMCLESITSQSSESVEFDIDSIENIPQELQEWASPRYSYSDGSSYIHMSDGTTYFRGRMAEKEHHGWDSYMDTETLVATNVNGNLTVYSQLHEPHSFVSINEGSGETMEGFCFLYTEFAGHDDEEIYEYTTQAVACVSSNENISQGFRNTTLLNSDGGGWLESVGKAHDGRYWIRLQEDRFVDEWSSYQEVLHIIQLDPQSMMYTVVANSTSFPDFQQPLRNEGSRCFRWTSGIGYVAAAISLFLSALVLLLFIKTKSGAGCLALSIFAVRLWLEETWLDETWLDMLSPVLLVFTFICLCTASLSLAVREMVLWGIYSVIVVQLVLAFVNREFPVMGTIGLGMGLALDHPVLQLGGWIGAPLSVCILLYYAIVGFFGDIYGFYMSIGYLYGRHLALVMLAYTPVSVIIGCGMVTAGPHVSRYRAILLFYLRRYWRSLRVKLRRRSRPQSSNGKMG